MKKLSLLFIVFAMVASMFACSGDTTYITISPKKYDFDIVRYGESATTDFIFTNKYKVDITITSIDITGTTASQFVVTVGGNSGTIVPGNKGTHTISVEFTPTGGAAEAMMEINYNDDKGNPKMLEIKLVGDCEAAPLFMSSVSTNPPTCDLGICNQGLYIDETITITNDGIADLNITDVQIGGTDYKVQAGWTGVAVVIAPAATHDITVRFEPTANGVLNDTLTITHDATNTTSPYEVDFNGEGIDPQFATNIVGTPEIDFGDVLNGVTSASAKFEIVNNGTSDLEISNMQISSSDFTFVSGWSGTPVAVTAGGSKEFEISFSPTATGAISKDLTISHNATNEASPYTITLKGSSRDNYKAETFTKGMTPISGGTPVYLSDDDFTNVPIGFNFNFYGQSYTQISICSNGFVGFGPTTDYDWGEDSFPLPSTYTSNNCIYLFNLDLDPSYGGNISYKVEGSSPNRVFVVEFNQVPDYFGAGMFTGQVRLYETSNIIELHFSTTNMSWTTVSWSENIIGIENQSGTKGVDYDGVKANPANSLPTDNIRYK